MGVGFGAYYTPPQNIYGHCEERSDEAIPASSATNNEMAPLALAMTRRSGGAGK